jgi:hypothetical protein
MKLKRNLKQKITALIKPYFLACITLCGCDSRNSLQHLDSQNLQTLARACRTETPSAPGQAIACQNVQRECTRRAELGLGACL